jgi:hypothetical protein
MIDDHCHCCLCYHPIVTTKVLEDGTVQAVPFKTVNQARLIMSAPGQFAMIQLTRPACNACFKGLEDQERLEASRSRLVVAPAGAIPQTAN